MPSLDGRRLRRDRNREAVVQALLEPLPRGQPDAEHRRDRRAGRDLRPLAVPLLRRRRRPGPHRGGAPAGAPRTRSTSCRPDRSSRSGSGWSGSWRIAPACSTPWARSASWPGPSHRASPRSPPSSAGSGPCCAARSSTCSARSWPSCRPAEHDGVLAALDVACSWEARHLLRQDQRLGKAAAARVMALSIRRLLGVSALMRGSVRRERAIDVPADRGLGGREPAGAPPPVVPGRSSPASVDGDTRTITLGTRDAAPRDAAHQRRAAAPVPVPDRGRALRRAPGDDRRDRARRARAASSSTAATPTRRTMAVVLGGATGGALDELARQLESGSGRRSTPSPCRPRPTEPPPDGPQDPLHHHRPAALRHPRLQRRRRSAAHRSSTASPPTGIRYERAVPQSVVCMPSRSTMLTGQHPSTHGVWMNGVALPVDAPSVAAVLHQAGYRTALVGKPHFEPFLDPFGRFTENSLATDGLPTAQTPVGRRHRRSAPRLRPPRVRHPHAGRATSTTPAG